MPLQAGTSLGGYKIQSLLGLGGMGEVYCARDVKLGRDVAIKVLPSTISTDPDRVQRFAREAQLLASLNSPYIAAIYGAETHGDVTALVLELVPGQTLEEVVRRRRMEVPEALEVGRQIACALESAHERGVVHRDIKPANIKITDEGNVKVLDFGLAKALESGTMPAASVTTATFATEAGIVVGTSAYMSPEQATGRTVDRRTDIWSFGCVLYEMLAGRRAFGGRSHTEVIAAILTKDADLQQLPAATPPSVRELLQRCFERDPKERLRDIGEARVVLGRPADPVRPPLQGRSPKQPIAAVGAAVLLITAGTLGFLAGGSRRALGPSTAPTVHLEMPLAPAERLEGSEYLRPVLRAFAISNDGRFVVFSGRLNGQAAVLRRRLHDRAAAVIPGTDGGRSPFLSPDDRWVGFTAGGTLRKVPVDGGAPVTVCPVPSFAGATWSEDGTITFGTTNGSLWRVPDGGGTPQAITSLNARKHEVAHRLPYSLPGDRGVLFTAASGIRGLGRVLVLPRGSREPRQLLDDAADARYAEGQLLYARNGTVYAVPFDLERLAAGGPSQPVFEGVMQSVDDDNPSLNSGAAQYDVSKSGALVVAEGGGYPPHMNRLLWLDRRGGTQPIGDPAPNLLGARLSPDERQIAVALVNRDEQPIRIYDLDRGGFIGLPEVTGDAAFPVWAPDGRAIAVHWKRADAGAVYVVKVDGSAPPRRIAATGGGGIPADFSRDGRALAYLQRDPETGLDIWVASVEGTGEPRRVVATAGADRHPTFSPDGRWIAYTSDVTGSDEVFITAYPGPGPRVQVSVGSGAAPVWLRDGRRLLYVSGKRLLEVPVQTEPALRVGSASAVVPFEYLIPAPSRSHDVTLDGQRLVVTTWESRPDQPVSALQVVLNWRSRTRPK